MDASISHYIEAGATVKALEAAIGAKQWRKAVQVCHVAFSISSNFHLQIDFHFRSLRLLMIQLKYVNMQCNCPIT